MNRILSKMLERKIEMAWDISFLHCVRKLSDGLTFFSVNINLDLYKGDHKPYFTFNISALNYRIIDIEYYNIYHEDKQ